MPLEHIADGPHQRLGRRALPVAPAVHSDRDLHRLERLVFFVEDQLDHFGQGKRFNRPIGGSRFGSDPQALVEARLVALPNDALRHQA